MLSNWIYLMMKAAFCMGVFYLVYCLLLKKETHFTLSRFYLLSTVMLSIVIPLIRLGIHAIPDGLSNSYILETISVGSRIVEDTFPDNQMAFQIVLVIYLAGVAVFLLQFLIRIFRLVIIIKRYGRQENNGMKLVFLPPGGGSPFSFFHYVFMTRDHFMSGSSSKILTHEKIHITQRHSLDLLLLEVIFLLQWFNPVVWLYKKSIKQVHEYLADDGVLRQFHDMSAYQHILLNIGSGLATNTFAHNFNHSLLKRRFIMMTKSKSLPQSRWKILTVIPMIAVLMLMFSDVSGHYLDQALSWGKPGMAIIGSLSGVTFTREPIEGPLNHQVVQQQNDSVYTRVDEAPAFKGGQDALIKYISQNIVYPEQARKQGIKGTVFITFLIDETGKVANGQVLRGIGSGCDEEALRVVMAMPDWNPGKNNGLPVKVQFNLPIKFSLSNEAKKDVGTDIKMDTPKDDDPK